MQSTIFFNAVLLTNRINKRLSEILTLSLKEICCISLFQKKNFNAIVFHTTVVQRRCSSFKSFFVAFRIFFPVSTYEQFFIQLTLNRSNHRRCSIKKVVLRNFAKFIGKHQCQSLFLIKLQLY